MTSQANVKNKTRFVKNPIQDPAKK